MSLPIAATSSTASFMRGEIKKGYTHFAEGDVGLAKITPCFENGKSTVFRNLTGDFGSGTTELHILRPVLVDPDYVVLFMKSPQFIESGILRMTGTAGQKRVSSEYFTSSPFPLPPLAEQHRIVAKVDELMALCDRLEEARKTREESRDKLTAASLARLTALDTTPEDFPAHAAFALEALPALTTRADQIKTLRQTILNLAVRGRLVKQDPTDEPASNLLEKAKEDIAEYGQANGVRPAKVDKIGDFPFDLPSGWAWTRLASIFRVVTDGDHQPPPRVDSGVAFLTIGNVSGGTLEFDGCRRVPQEYFDALPRYRTPSAGDLLYTVVGATFGRPVVVDDHEPFCVQRHIAILKPASVQDLRVVGMKPFATASSPVAGAHSIATRSVC